MGRSKDRESIDRSLLGIVDTIYAAALDTERWQQVIDEIVRLFDTVGGSCGIIPPHTPEQAALMALSGNSPAEAVAEYRAYYHAKDVLMHEVERRPNLIGTPASIERILPRPVFERSEVWNDFLHRYGVREIYYLLVGGKAAPIAMVNLMMPRIDADDATLASYALDILRPHLERAFAIRGQLQFERLRGEAGLVGLDALEIGVALLDPEARVLFLNAPAETILRARDGLSLRGQTLQASGTAHDRFAAAVRRCCVLGGDLIAVPRPSGRRPYVLSIVPSGSGRDRLPVRAATVFITDPEKQPRSNIDAVRAAYGLTEAEAKLCTRLHEGLTLKQVAERSGISLNTAKTHLASVFGKTSTGRQSELIKLLTAPFISRA